MFTEHRYSAFRILLLAVVAVTIGTIVLTGSAAAEFKVDIDESKTDTTVEGGGNLTVFADIENTDSIKKTQTITLVDTATDNQLNQTSVTVGPGKTEPINLTWMDVDSEPETDEEVITPSIQSEDSGLDAADNINATILWTNFEVQDFSVNRTSLSSGEELNFSATIKNTGTAVGKQGITLNRPSKPNVKNTETLDGDLDNNGESTEVTFNKIKAPTNRGDYTYTVSTENETSDGESVTVSGGFSVEIDDTSTDGTNLTIDATFSKRGEHTDTQNISFEVDGSPVKFRKDGTVVKASDQETVTVDGTEEAVSFTHDTGSLTFTKNISITTVRPDTATTTITKTDNRNLGRGNFEVSINDSLSDKSVSANGDLSIYADITNTGPNNATQTVQLADSDGNVQQEKDVLINDNKKKTVEFVWESVPGSEREVLPTVKSQNDSATVDEFIPVLSNQFEVQEVTVDEQSGRIDTEFNFNATIRNVGTTNGRQDISLIGPDGTELDEVSTPLSAKEQDKVKFQPIKAPSSPGVYEYTVESETEGESATQSITAGAFNVEIDDWSVEGTSVRVDATLSKLGTYTDTQTVNLTVNGSSNPADTDVTLEGTTPETITLSSNLGSGFPKTIRVRTPYDSAVTRVAKANIEDGPAIDSVADNLVQSGDTLEFTYTADGPNVNTVTISLIGPEGRIVATKPLGPGDGAKESIEIPGRDEVFDGGYSMRLLATDDFDRRVSVTENSAFAVSNAINPEAVGAFGEAVTRSPAGSFVSIPTGGEYMIIGGDKRDGDRTQFLDVLHVSGSAVLNTRRVGTDVSSSVAYGDGVTSYAHKIGADAGAKEREGTVFEGVSFQGASSLAEFRQELDIDSRTRPLQAGQYQLVAGENGRIQIRNGAPDFSRPVGRSNLILTQTQRIGEIKTYVAPPGPADESAGQLPGGAVEGDTVTIGERLIIEVPAIGMWGATLQDPETELTPKRIARLLDRQEGVHIEFDGKRGDPNAGLGKLQFESVTSSDISVSKTTGDLIDNETVTGAQPIIDGYYIVIDTRGTKPFSTQPEPGSVFEFDMAYESPPGESYRFESSSGQPEWFSSGVEPQDGIEHYPYFGDDDTTVERNATVRFTEPSITYARTRPDGSLIVPAEEDGQIFGSTTMVPGSQVTIRLVGGDGPNPDLVDIVETTVEDDRTFAASADFSELTPGQRVEVEFASQNRLSGNRVIDKRSAYVVDNFDNPARFQITSFAGDIQVQQRDALDELQATITNNGSIAGRQLIEFRIGGEPIRNETITIGSGGSKTLDLSGQFVTLPTGTYQYTVETDDDQRTGQLTVGAPDTGTVITDTASQGATTSGQVGGGETTGGTDDGGDSTEPSGLFSLMGVRTRDVAVATAIAGATHILGYWT